MDYYMYHGCFVDKHQLKDIINNSSLKLSRTALEKEIEFPHVTFKYAPKDIDVATSLFGSHIKVVAVGYGNNGENEGLLVKVFSDIPWLQEKIDKIPVPHITLSTSATGEAKNTSNLDFREIEPIEMTCIYGAYTHEMALEEPPILHNDELELEDFGYQL